MYHVYYATASYTCGFDCSRRGELHRGPVYGGDLVLRGLQLQRFGLQGQRHAGLSVRSLLVLCRASRRHIATTIRRNTYIEDITFVSMTDDVYDTSA